jgi:hypothetical protein
VSVLDFSEEALADARRRLGGRAGEVCDHQADHAGRRREDRRSRERPFWAMCALVSSETQKTS